MTTLRTFIRQILLETDQNSDKPLSVYSRAGLEKGLSATAQDEAAIKGMNEQLVTDATVLIDDVNKILSPLGEPGGAWITRGEETAKNEAIISALERDKQIAGQSIGEGFYIYPYRTALVVMALAEGEVYAGEAWSRTIADVTKIRDALGKAGSYIPSLTVDTSTKTNESKRSYNLLKEAFAETIAAVLGHIVIGEFGTSAARMIPLDVLRQAMESAIKEAFKDPVAFKSFLQEIEDGAITKASSSTMKNLPDQLQQAFYSFLTGIPYRTLQKRFSLFNREIIAAGRVVPNLTKDATYDAIHKIFQEVTAGTIPKSSEEARIIVRKQIAAFDNANPVRQVLNIANEAGQQTSQHSGSDIKIANDYIDSLGDTFFELTEAMFGQLALPKFMRKATQIGLQAGLRIAEILATVFVLEYVLFDPSTTISEENLTGILRHNIIVKSAQESLADLMSDRPTFLFTDAGIPSQDKFSTANNLLKNLFERKSTTNLKSNELDPVIEAFKASR